ncbi:MAG: hypothetical protein IJV44_04140 [Prevotella sp.]|nr:hypothetical protein [Prevotella sp.]
MKKIGIYLIGAALLVSSCGTYTGQGAYAGATFGSILGSAIGGISGGWRGSDIGTIVGMAGGAAVGAAIGAAADQKQQEKIEGYHQSGDSGFDATNSGDDRIDIGIEGPKGEFAAPTSRVERMDNSHAAERIVIRNAHFMDNNQDGVLEAGEECKISFEIMNYSGRTLYDVQPMVYEVTGNKNLHISPNLHVESIAPNSGVRYTATILAGKKLKDGTAKIRVGATVGSRELSAQEKEFTVVTRRR